jgi:hypothetical protein
VNGFEGVYGVNPIDLGMENPDVGALELNHVNVQQCYVVHGVLVKKNAGMIHGIDAIPSAGEVLPVIVVVANNDVCLL